MKRSFSLADIGDGMMPPLPNAESRAGILAAETEGLAPVVAATGGRVEKLFLSKDGGNTVYQRSPDGRRIYYYAHLDAYAQGLREGMMLAQGAPVGTVGSTGNADPSAPHLHFAVWMTSPDHKWWEDAVALNPYPLLTGR